MLWQYDACHGGVTSQRGRGVLRNAAATHLYVPAWWRAPSCSCGWPASCGNDTWLTCAAANGQHAESMPWLSCMSATPTQLSTVTPNLEALSAYLPPAHPMSMNMSYLKPLTSNLFPCLPLPSLPSRCSSGASARAAA